MMLMEREDPTTRTPIMIQMNPPDLSGLGFGAIETMTDREWLDHRQGANERVSYMLQNGNLFRCCGSEGASYVGVWQGTPIHEARKPYLTTDRLNQSIIQLQLDRYMDTKRLYALILTPKKAPSGEIIGGFVFQTGGTVIDPSSSPKLIDWIEAVFVFNEASPCCCCMQPLFSLMRHYITILRITGSINQSKMIAINHAQRPG